MARRTRLKNLAPKPPPKTGRMAFTPRDLELGERIRLRRIELGWSQGDLGAKIGVSFQQIQKYEKGRNHVSIVRLEQIAGVLGTPVSFFYQERNGKQQEVESLLSLDPDVSLRLLRAYAQVKDAEARRKIVGLIEDIVGTMK